MHFPRICWTFQLASWNFFPANTTRQHARAQSYKNFRRLTTLTWMRLAPTSGIRLSPAFTIFLLYFELAFLGWIRQSSTVRRPESFSRAKDHGRQPQASDHPRHSNERPSSQPWSFQRKWSCEKLERSNLSWKRRGKSQICCNLTWIIQHFWIFD